MRADPATETMPEGLRVRVTPEEEARERNLDPVLDQHGMGDPRWLHAKARIFRILDGAGQSGAKTIEAGLRDAEMPKLAREFGELIAHYKFFRFRRSRWNPFYGMSDVDAAKKFLACVFAICDRSTGKLGPWWVK